MTVSKHTARPWVAVPNVYEGHDVSSWSIRERTKSGRVIAQITSPIKRSPEEKRANALLIEAAPVMYHAIRRLIADLNDSVLHFDDDSTRQMNERVQFLCDSIASIDGGAS